jgi:hypothetical protein
MAGATGLDYGAVIQTLKELGFKRRKALLKGIKMMETEIVGAWAKERDRK